MTLDPQSVDDFLAPGDVTPGSAERLGEGPHQDVDVLWVDPEVVRNATSAGPHSANRVGLVDE